jgi:hypothetical protein
MNRRVHRLRSVTILTALALATGFLAGCGKDNAALGPRVKPKGRILKNGLPLQYTESPNTRLPPGDPGMQVIFIKVGTSDAGTEIPARIVDPREGTFDLAGEDGNGIPPGKYRIAVILAPVGGTDVFKGKFDRTNSKIERELKGNEDVVIDVDKPNG